jgi:hypothetical protein
MSQLARRARPPQEHLHRLSHLTLLLFRLYQHDQTKLPLKYRLLMRYENKVVYLELLKTTATVLLYHCHERRRSVQRGRVDRHAKLLLLSFDIFRFAVASDCQ